MDASIILALAALTGAAVGGLTSGIANWLRQRPQLRAEWIQGGAPTKDPREADDAYLARM